MEKPMTSLPPSVNFIGSCRVHNALHSLGVRGLINVSRSSLGIYTHSAREAIQRLKLLGGQHIPEHLNKYVYDRDAAPEVNGASFDALQKVDLHIIEVCSPRELSWKGHPLQINFFSKHLLEKCPSLLFPWFADLNNLRKWDNDRIRDLSREPSWVSAGLTDADAELMEGVNYFVHDAASLTKEIHSLVALAGKPVIFVSHFNISAIEAEQIKIRRELAEMLMVASHDAGARLYDPTNLILSVGRENALASNGVDVNHYASEFESVLSDDFYRTMLAPQGTDRDRNRVESSYEASVGL